MNTEKITALLVDDEPQALKGLASMIGLFCPGVTVVGTASSVREAVVMIRELKPDVAFLDISLRDGTGFEVLEQRGAAEFHTIFVTAYDQHALRAIKLNALDYLLKPVDPDDLVAAVARITSSSGAWNANTPAGESKIGIPGIKGTTYLELNSIIRLESSNNYTYIHCAEGRPLLVSKTIKLFEALLPADHFLRCHQRHIVNLEHVTALIRAETSFLELRNGFQAPISRSNRSRVEEILGKRFPSV